MKTCNMCHKNKQLEEFNQKQGKCKVCQNEYRRNWREGNESERLKGLSLLKSRRKTKKGFLSDRWNDMKRRVDGKHTRKSTNTLYKGLEICSKEEFISWAEKDLEFNNLFVQYKNSEGVRALAPSIDRIDSSKGYTLDNMRFLTLSENGRLGANSRWFNQIKGE